MRLVWQQQIFSWADKDSIVIKKSKVIQNLGFQSVGDITEISGRTLTLNYEDDVLLIPIADDALIRNLFINEETKKGEAQEIDFEDIKIGDKVSILVGIKPDGRLEGTDVSIFPR